MKKYVPVLAAVALALTVSACAEERAASLPPGQYEKYNSTTDANGTTYDKKTTTDVSVDRYGNKRVVDKVKTTKDPKGLFNKSTTTETKKVITVPDNE